MAFFLGQDAFGCSEYGPAGCTSMMEGSCAEDLVLCTERWKSHSPLLVLAEDFGGLPAGTHMAVMAITAEGWAQAQRHPFEAMWVPADFLEPRRRVGFPLVL